MRGLDKALEEVKSARNRVSRLYGLGRLSRPDMQRLTTSLEAVEDQIAQTTELTNDDGEPKRIAAKK